MKILVIGDSCEDVFRYGEVNRLAPEAPVPIIKPDKERSIKPWYGRKCLLLI